MCDPLDFDAFIISGSRFNVRDGLVEGSQLSSWFNPLVALIQRLATENDETMAAKRMFGCCFGHQIIAHALGGEVAKNPGGEFILLAESLSFDREAIKQAPCCCDKSLGAILEKESVKVINSHGDSVISIPAKAWRLASSKSCANEVVQWAPNIMSCQGHPEFNMKYAIEERIWPAVVKKNKRLSEEGVQAAKESFTGFSRESGPDLLVLFMTEFIRGGKQQ
jgi:GMP synthase-like glutamine amidotransferase